MSKRHKKRTKRYQGDDAKVTTSREPVVHHYEAVQRSRLGEWWQTRRRAVKLGALATAIVGGGALLTIELIRIILP
ncbi:MAG TPA: hypothetical protein VF597_01745 [Candidatus Saccharimonadales bacterium]